MCNNEIKYTTPYLMSGVKGAAYISASSCFPFRSCFVLRGGFAGMLTVTGENVYLEAGNTIEDQGS